MKAPPKTQRKLSAEAQRELGMPRECETCGEIKAVTEKNYALHKRGLRGWHKTCRVCQGVAKAEKGPVGFKPARDRGLTDTSALIDEMYLLHQSNQRADRVDEIAAELSHRVRALAADDKAAAFDLFIDVVKPLVANWMEPGLIHEDIKRGLLSDHPRTLIIATRFSAKSTLTAIYVTFEIFLDELIKVMVISRGSKLAARMLRTVRRVFIANCPMLKHLEPTDECLDNAEQFQTPGALKVVTGGATMTSLGMGSNLPGFRSDLTIGDDVEGPQDDTPEKVQDLEEALNELHMINPKGRKVMLGTYQTEFSIYAKLADLHDDTGAPVWNSVRACMFEENEDTGEITSRWTGMFSHQDALDWRRSVTGRAWRLHAMLVADPSVLHERPLKIADLPVLDWNPAASSWPLSFDLTTEEADVPRWSAPKGDKWYWARPMGPEVSLAGITMAVDPASGLAGRDAIGVAVLGITQSGFGIILHLEGVRSHDKSLARRRVAQIAQHFKATSLVVEELENGLFGETLEGELVQVGYPMSVEKVTTGGQQKGRRIIESLAPPMGAGRILVLERVARSDHGGEFVNQLVRISYDGRTGKAKDHDDIVDALAHAVAKEKHSLISDVADNRAEHNAAQLDRWRGVPLREGGLGAFDKDEYPNSRRLELHGEQDLVEAMLQEDEVLISLKERRDRLQELVNQDMRYGRGADPGMVDRIRRLTSQIQDLQELSVL